MQIGGRIGTNTSSLYPGDLVFFLFVGLITLKLGFSCHSTVCFHVCLLC